MTTLQSDFNPVRMGVRIGQDLLNDSPRLFSAALIFFSDNVYDKANPD
jgi:hypothetical protein